MGNSIFTTTQEQQSQSRSPNNDSKSLRPTEYEPQRHAQHTSKQSQQSSRTDQLDTKYAYHTGQDYQDFKPVQLPPSLRFRSRAAPQSEKQDCESPKSNCYRPKTSMYHSYCWYETVSQSSASGSPSEEALNSTSSDRADPQAKVNDAQQSQNGERFATYFKPPCSALIPCHKPNAAETLSQSPADQAKTQNNAFDFSQTYGPLLQHTQPKDEDLSSKDLLVRRKVKTIKLGICHEKNSGTLKSETTKENTGSLATHQAENEQQSTLSELLREVLRQVYEDDTIPPSSVPVLPRTHTYGENVSFSSRAPRTQTVPDSAESYGGERHRLQSGFAPCEPLQAAGNRVDTGNNNRLLSTRPIAQSLPLCSKSSSTQNKSQGPGSSQLQHFRMATENNLALVRTKPAPYSDRSDMSKKFPVTCCSLIVPIMLNVHPKARYPSINLFNPSASSLRCPEKFSYRDSKIKEKQKKENAMKHKESYQLGKCCSYIAATLQTATFATSDLNIIEQEAKSKNSKARRESRNNGPRPVTQPCENKLLASCCSCSSVAPQAFIYSPSDPEISREEGEESKSEEKQGSKIIRPVPAPLSSNKKMMTSCCSCSSATVQTEIFAASDDNIKEIEGEENASKEVQDSKLNHAVPATHSSSKKMLTSYVSCSSVAVQTLIFASNDSDFATEEEPKKQSQEDRESNTNGLLMVNQSVQHILLMSHCSCSSAAVQTYADSDIMEESQSKYDRESSKNGPLMVNQSVQYMLLTTRSSVAVQTNAECDIMEDSLRDPNIIDHSITTDHKTTVKAELEKKGSKIANPTEIVPEENVENFKAQNIPDSNVTEQSDNLVFGTSPQSRKISGIGITDPKISEDEEKRDNKSENIRDSSGIQLSKTNIHFSGSEPIILEKEKPQDVKEKNISASNVTGQSDNLVSNSSLQSKKTSELEIVEREKPQNGSNVTRQSENLVSNTSMQSKKTSELEMVEKEKPQNVNAQNMSDSNVTGQSDNPVPNASLQSKKTNELEMTEKENPKNAQNMSESNVARKSDNLVSNTSLQSKKTSAFEIVEKENSLNVKAQNISGSNATGLSDNVVPNTSQQSKQMSEEEKKEKPQKVKAQKISDSNATEQSDNLFPNTGLQSKKISQFEIKEEENSQNVKVQNMSYSNVTGKSDNIGPNASLQSKKTGAFEIVEKENSQNVTAQNISDSNVNGKSDNLLPNTSQQSKKSSAPGITDPKISKEEENRNNKSELIYDSRRIRQSKSNIHVIGKEPEVVEKENVRGKDGPSSENDATTPNETIKIKPSEISDSREKVPVPATSDINGLACCCNKSFAAMQTETLAALKTWNPENMEQAKARNTILKLLCDPNLGQESGSNGSARTLNEEKTSKDNFMKSQESGIQETSGGKDPEIVKQQENINEKKSLDSSVSEKQPRSNGPKSVTHSHSNVQINEPPRPCYCPPFAATSPELVESKISDTNAKSLHDSNGSQKHIENISSGNSISSINDSEIMEIKGGRKNVQNTSHENHQTEMNEPSGDNDANTKEYEPNPANYEKQLVACCCNSKKKRKKNHAPPPPNVAQSRNIAPVSATHENDNYQPMSSCCCSTEIVKEDTTNCNFDQPRDIHVCGCNPEIIDEEAMNNQMPRENSNFNDCPAYVRAYGQLLSTYSTEKSDSSEVSPHHENKEKTRSANIADRAKLRSSQESLKKGPSGSNNTQIKVAPKGSAIMKEAKTSSINANVSRNPNISQEQNKNTPAISSNANKKTIRDPNQSQERGKNNAVVDSHSKKKTIRDPNPGQEQRKLNPAIDSHSNKKSDNMRDSGRVQRSMPSAQSRKYSYNTEIKEKEHMSHESRTRQEGVPYVVRRSNSFYKSKSVSIPCQTSDRAVSACQPCLSPSLVTETYLFAACNDLIRSTEARDNNVNKSSPTGDSAPSCGPPPPVPRRKKKKSTENRISHRK